MSSGDIGVDNLREAITARFGGMDVELPIQDPSAPFSLSTVQLGNISVFRYEGEGVHRVNRRWDHIRNDSMDCYAVHLPLSAKFTVGRSGVESDIPPGSFSFLSSAEPFHVVECSAAMSFDPFVSIHLCIPGPLLRSRFPQIKGICNSPLGISQGASGIMMRMVEAALQDGPFLSPTHAAGFGAEILESVVRTAESAVEINGPPSTSRQNSRTRIFRQAVSFIEANLSDPSLDAKAVAENCRVSVRYLYDAFETSGQTIGAFIRELRLQLCRKVLCSPSARHRPILDVATDWGFNDASHFSHAYKRRFGVAPSEDRLRSTN
jgi:AraC family transcriptional activator of tynA and feaB